jgi:hypothetical protein
LIERGLSRNGQLVTLDPLDDETERVAHASAVDRAVKTK